MHLIEITFESFNVRKWVTSNGEHANKVQGGRSQSVALYLKKYKNLRMTRKWNSVGIVFEISVWSILCPYNPP